jgi:hypothetical protein
MSNTTQLNDLLEEDLSIIIDDEIFPNSVINDGEENLQRFQNTFGKTDMSPLNEASLTSEPSSIVIPETISIPLDFPKEIANDEPQQISINLESSPVSELSTAINRLVESDVINQSQPQTLPEAEVIGQSQPQPPLNTPINSNEPVRSTSLDDLDRAMFTSVSEREFYKSLFGESFVNRSTINELNKVASQESIAESMVTIDAINTFNNINEVNSTASQKKSLDETLRIIEQSYGFNIDSPKSNEAEEVTQTKIDLPMPVTQNTAQTGVNVDVPQSSQSTQLQMANSSQNTEEVSAKIVSINEVSEKNEMAQMPPINVKTEIDLSALEQRLARIEYALSFPLEVKIVS